MMMPRPKPNPAMMRMRRGIRRRVEKVEEVEEVEEVEKVEKVERG